MKEIVRFAKFLSIQGNAHNDLYDDVVDVEVITRIYRK